MENTIDNNNNNNTWSMNWMDILRAEESPRRAKLGGPLPTKRELFIVGFLNDYQLCDFDIEVTQTLEGHVDEYDVICRGFTGVELKFKVVSSRFAFRVYPQN